MPRARGGGAKPLSKLLKEKKHNPGGYSKEEKVEPAGRRSELTSRKQQEDLTVAAGRSGPGRFKWARYTNFCKGLEAVPD